MHVRAAGLRLCTTRINEAEFRVGIYRASDADYERREVERVMSMLDMLELDTIAAERFAIIKAYQFSVGRPAGDMDGLIAAVSVAHGQTLITRNPRHFADVPGLIVETY